MHPLSRLTNKVINTVIIPIPSSIADTNDVTTTFSLVTGRKTKTMENEKWQQKNYELLIYLIVFSLLPISP